MEYPSCTCAKCIEACQCHPGWFSPIEAEKAIDEGYARMLMLDFLGDSTSNPIVYVLSPASLNYEGKCAPTMPSSWVLRIGWVRGPCVFLTEEGRCTIHNTDFKPIECKKAYLCAPLSDAEIDKEHMSVARMWLSPRGKKVIERWKKEVDFKPPKKHI